MLVRHHPFLDARIFHKEAKSLMKKGYDVTLVVPRKKGYLYDIDGTLFIDQFRQSKFTHEGIKIVTYDDKREKLNKMVKNLKSREKYKFNDPLLKTGFAQNADIYHAHEFLSLYSGIGIKRAMKKQKGKNIKLIYDSHELVPDPLEMKHKNKRKVELLRKMLFYMLKETDYILTVSDSIKAWYLSLNPFIPVEVIYNTPLLAKEYKQKNYQKDGLVACYEGSIHKMKGSKEKLFAITNICSQSIDFTFKIIGGVQTGESLSVPDKLKDKFIQLGWVKYTDIPQYMMDVDIGWIDFDVSKSLNRSYALPNKFFSYLNNGVPVIVNKCHEMGNFIRKYQCGLVLDKYNPAPEDYAKAILYLHERKDVLKRMSINARKTMEQTYCWEHMEQRLVNVYRKIWSDNTQFI